MEKPILFNGDMVRAIIAGNKTVTRRPVNPQPISIQLLYKDGDKFYIDNPITGAFERKPPYQPGDILYVRETWCRDDLDGSVYYRASYTDIEAKELFTDLGLRWSPSIHMPKDVARIFLRVTGVRVERLQEITEEGAVAEGFKPVKCGCSNRGAYGCTDCMNTGMLEPALLGFVDTWNDIYAKRGYGWEQNPWVEVTEFERVTP